MSAPWIAIRVASCCEFVVAAELEGEDIKAYCPTGRRFINFEHGRRVKKTVRLFPVFARYIFAQPSDSQVIRRNTRRHIESILSDDNGPLRVPSPVIARLIELEDAGEWDACRSWREKSAFQPGAAIEVIDGPFSGLRASVEALLSEARIRALVDIFGRMTPIDFHAGQLRPIGELQHA